MGTPCRAREGACIARDVSMMNQHAARSSRSLLKQTRALYVPMMPSFDVELLLHELLKGNDQVAVRPESRPEVVLLEDLEPHSPVAPSDDTLHVGVERGAGVAEPLTCSGWLRYMR